VYERRLSTPGDKGWELTGWGEDVRGAYAIAATLRRLGELYEARGDRAKAREYYGHFVDLWKDADPELQPLVVDARASLKRLSAERP